MKKVLKYFLIFAGVLMLIGVVMALLDPEGLSEPEKVETSAPVEEKEEVIEKVEPEEVKEESKTETSTQIKGNENADVSSTIEAFKSNDFMEFTNAFYGLTGTERSDVYRSTVEGTTVTWSGIVTDLETVKDSIIMLGKTDAYNGEDWITLNHDHEELLPYVIIVEMNNPSVKEGLNKGDNITLTGEIGARGDVEAGFNWKLYKGEIAN